jgi:hypothetical protein
VRVVPHERIGASLASPPVVDARRDRRNSSDGGSTSQVASRLCRLVEPLELVNRFALEGE